MSALAREPCGWKTLWDWGTERRHAPSVRSYSNQDREVLLRVPVQDGARQRSRRGPTGSLLAGLSQRSTNLARLSSDDPSPAAWSSAEIPSGTSSATISSSPSGLFGHHPGHRHGACALGRISDEVHDLHNSIVGDDVQVPDIHDVGVGGPRGLWRVSVRVSEQESVRATWPRAEPLEASCHVARSQPCLGCLLLNESVEDTVHPSRASTIRETRSVLGIVCIVML